MKEVRMQKAKLMAIVKKNREEHRQIFIDAQKAYRQRAIEVLDQQLKLARDGQPFTLRTVIELVAPEDHTRDYDRAIQMLELSVDKTITLSTADFANLVQDSWNWSRQWALSNSRYTVSPKFSSLMDED
jgi:hypothetical protein